MPDNNKYGIALSAPKYFPTRVQESAVIRLVILSNQAFQTPSMLFSRFPRDGLEFLAVANKRALRLPSKSSYLPSRLH